MNAKTQKTILNLKKKYPGVIILFRIDNNYEAINSDAETVSQLLGSDLVESENKTISRAFFHHHHLELYLLKLIRAGHRVAVVDQLN
jgi:DNA mismatch repair protein MutS